MAMYRLIVILLICISFEVEAHQPKLIYDSPSKKNPFVIRNPETSKAFYGKLTGEPHYFKIESSTDFLFYTGILSPKINDTYRWFSLDVMDDKNVILFQADGKSFRWTPWYEPYARDYYWKGPEIGTDIDKEFKTSFILESGTYYIKVYNERNQGSYSLAVGEAEFFGANLWEQILTWVPILIYTAPYMDIVYWQKFDFRAYLVHIVLLITVYVIYLVFKKLKKFLF